MTNYTMSLKHVADLIGSDCIYAERGRICHVRLQALSINGSTLKLTLKPIQSTGFATLPSRTFKVACALEYLSFGKNMLTASIVGWRLFSGKTNVKKTINSARGLPSTQELLDELRKIR
jgi:hypothetical protein